MDSRWGPPKNGLREPMAWQYADMDKNTPTPEASPEPSPFPNPTPILVVNSQTSSLVPTAQAYRPPAPSLQPSLPRKSTAP
ncbi:hypothetical protein N9165_01720 [Akkermansiaceae bacterium]|nr:hypothetical protein [Akkermansiaceae bacterium]